MLVPDGLISILKTWQDFKVRSLFVKPIHETTKKHLEILSTL